MKKTMLILAIISVMIAGVLSTGCNSDQQKMLEAKQKVEDANRELEIAEQKLAEEKMEKEWAEYKSECMLQIAINDSQIEGLEKAISLNKKGYNKDYIDKVNKLKAENNQIRSRIGVYEENKDISTWEIFKEEINRDMKSIVETFKNLTASNTD